MADYRIVPVADSRFSRDTLIEADRLAKRAPEQLTDLHLAHLAHYVSARALTDIIERREIAVQQRADQAFAAAQAEAADQRKAIEPPAALEATSLEGVSSFAEICAQHPGVPATLAMLADVVAFTQAMNAKNVERNAKIQRLEQQVAALEAAAIDRVRSECATDSQTVTRTGAALPMHGSTGLM